MKVYEQLKEYIWLLNTIRKYRKISFDEIQEKWLDTEMSGGVELAKSTFHRHREAIEDIFGLFISCDRSNGYRYFIENEDVLNGDTVQNWMLSTISVGNMVSEAMAMNDRILLENVPCNDFLNIIIFAMKKKVRIEVVYRKYGNTDSPTRVDFEPYCIKLFKQRWYVLAHFFRAATKDKPERNYFGLYAFDRIIDVKLTNIKFEIDPEFDARDYFSECWGVFSGNGTLAERVVIRAFGNERFYMRDLPLHHSQRSIASGDDYEDFELFIRPTLDFRSHLLSKSNNLKVISPQSLADEIREMLRNTLALYE